jgi:hypothetical protein
MKPYSERAETFHSEYAFIIILWQVVQKLCVEKKWIPPGLSIELIRIVFYVKFLNHDLFATIQINYCLIIC